MKTKPLALRQNQLATAQSLVQGVINLVSLPEAYIRIRDLTNDPDSSINQISEIVITDPGLTAQLLKMANSAFFGYRQKVGTVSKAINIMGTSRLNDLALAASALSTFSNIPSDIVQMSEFWRRSVYCGIIARLLAEECNILDSERLFVTGLLSDLGHLIIYLKCPKQAVEAIKRSQQEALPIDQIERQILGFDYAEVGAELMKAWGLPDSIETTTRYHNEPTKTEKFNLEASLVHIARRISLYVYNDITVEESFAGLDPSALEVTGLYNEILSAKADESHEFVLETLQLLTPKTQSMQNGGAG